MTRVDGRTERRLRTRERIVSTVLDLIEHGDHAPTSRRIAERARISERTLFQHFADLEDVHAAVAQHKLESLVARFEPISPTEPFAARLAAFVRQRAALLEDLTPSRVAALRNEDTSTALAASRRRFTQLARRDVERTFAPELARAADPPTTLAAAAAVASWAYWDELRTGTRLSRASATRTVAAALAALLEAGS